MIWAIIKTTFEGYHQWEEAPNDVAFLRNLHRHIFWVELWIEQKHTERDIEYIREKRRLNEFLDYIEEIGSCEKLAEMIKDRWQKIHPDRKIKVFVFEDNENGCLIE